jgi:hypothetical protein
VATLLSSFRTLLAQKVEVDSLQPNDQASWDDLEWLEYRLSSDSGSALLGVYHWPLRRTVAADLWRPERFREAALPGVDKNAIADHHLVLGYGIEVDEHQTAIDVAGIVASWVAGAHRSGRSPSPQPADVPPP